MVGALIAVTVVVIVVVVVVVVLVGLTEKVELAITSKAMMQAALAKDKVAGTSTLALEVQSTQGVQVEGRIIKKLETKVATIEKEMGE